MILLTGSSGFIGTNFAKFFLDHKISFLGLDKKKNLYLNSKFFLKVNLLNKSKLNSIFLKYKPKLIIHLAANPGLNFCHMNQVEAFRNNIEASFNLLQACLKHNCKNIVSASSMAAENYSKNPSYYGFTKITLENLFYTYKEKFGLNSTILRFSNIFGPYSKHKNSAVHKMIQCVLNKKTFEIHGSGKQKRDFFYSEDLVLRTLKISKLNKRKLIYNINSKKKYSVNQIFSLIQLLCKKKINSKKIKPPKGFDVSYNDDKTDKIGFAIKKNLVKTINWYKENK